MFSGNLFAMFSNFRNFSSNLDTLLDNPEVTLGQVLDEESVISSLNTQNSKLIDYLSTDRLSNLLDFILVFPEEGSDNKRSFRYPFISCEIFCADCSPLSTKIFESEALLMKFFDFLDSSGNAIQVGYYSRIFLNFLMKNPKILLYLLAQLGFFPKLVQLLDFRAFGEVIEKIVIFEANVQESFIKQRVELVKQVALIAKEDGNKGKNAAQVLVNVLNWTGDINNRVLLVDFFQSEEFLDIVFESEILTVIKSLITSPLIRSREMILKKLSSFLPKMKKILESETEEMRNTLQEVMKTLGNRKILVISIVLEALKCREEGFYQELAFSGILEKILKLFWEHEWNSFLHVQVFSIAEIILLGQDSLKKILLDDSGLLQGIVTRFNSNPRKKTYHPEIKPGYDGVLIKIANLIEKVEKNSEEIEKITEKIEGWDDFKKNTLKNKNSIQSRQLGGYTLASFEQDDVPLPEEEVEKEQIEKNDENLLETDENDGNFQELELSPDVKKTTLEWKDFGTSVVDIDEEYWRF